MLKFHHRRLLAVTIVSLSLASVVPMWDSFADTEAAAPAAPAAAAAAAPAAAAPAAAAAAPAAAPAAALPSIVGGYDVSGVVAVDKSTYTGVALVTKKGEVYVVKYQDSEDNLTGVAFSMGNVLAIAYSSENKPTLVMMEPDGANGWKGRYVDMGDSFLSTEVWKRR